MKERAAVLDRPEADKQVPAEVASDITPEALTEEVEKEALEAQAMSSILAEEAEAQAGIGAESVREAYEDATAAARGRTAPLIEKLADRIGARATVKAAFGEPVVRGGLTVVPVARVVWGFGGGSGRIRQAPAGPVPGAARWSVRSATSRSPTTRPRSSHCAPPGPIRHSCSRRRSPAGSSCAGFERSSAAEVGRHRRS